MKKSKSVLSLFLAGLLCLSLLPVSALAEELPAELVDEEIVDVPVDVSEPPIVPEEPAAEEETPAPDDAAPGEGGELPIVPVEEPGPQTANNLDGDGVADEAALRSAIADEASMIQITGDVTLTSDLEIPSTATVEINGGSLTVASDATLYVNGRLNILNGAVLVSSGAELSNGNVIEVGCRKMDASYVPVLTVEGSYSALEYALLCQYDGAAITGVEGADITRDCYVGTEAALWTAIENSSGYGRMVIRLEEVVSLTANLIVPSNAEVFLYENFTVPEGFSLNNHGTLNVITSTLSVAGYLSNIGYINLTSVTDDLATLVLTGVYEACDGSIITVDPTSVVDGLPTDAYDRWVSVCTEADLRAMLTATEQPLRVEVSCPVTLTANLTIPANIQLTIVMGGSLSVPTSITLTNNGEIRVRDSTEFRVAEDGVYEQAEGASLVVEGSGSVGGVDESLITHEDDGDQMPEAATELELREALERGELFTRITGDIVLTEDLEIPGYCSVEIMEGSLTVSEGVTLTVTGSLNVLKNAMTVERGGVLVNASVLQVGGLRTEGMPEAAKLAVEGTYTDQFGWLFLYEGSIITGVEYEFIQLNCYAETEAELHTALANDDGYHQVTVSITEELALAEDLTIPESFRVCPQKALTVPSRVTLTINGELGLDSVTATVFGSLVNNGFLQLNCMEETLAVLNVSGDYAQGENGSLQTDLGGVITGVDEEYIQRRTSVWTEEELFSLIDFETNLSIDVNGNLELSENLTIPANIQLTISDSYGITVPEGIALENNGRIYVGGGGSFSVDDGGMYTQAESAELFAEEDAVVDGVDEGLISRGGGAAQVTDEESLVDAIERGELYIQIVRDVNLDDAIEIPEGTTVSVDGGSLTLAFGASLTVNGWLEIMDGSVTVLSGATLTNAGSIQVGGKSEDGQPIRASLQVDGTYVNQNGGLGLLDIATIGGIDPGLVGMYSTTVRSDEELRTALAKAETYSNAFPMVSIDEEFRLAEDLSVPVGVQLCVQDTFEIMADVTLTNNGQLNVTGSLTVDGNLVNYGWIDVAIDASLNVSGVYTPEEGSMLSVDSHAVLGGISPSLVRVCTNAATETELRGALENCGKYQSMLVNVSGEIALTADLAIPAGVRIDLWYSASVPADVTLTINGELSIEGCALTVAGVLENNGFLNMSSSELDTAVLTVTGSYTPGEHSEFWADMRSKLSGVSTDAYYRQAEARTEDELLDILADCPAVEAMNIRLVQAQITLGGDVRLPAGFTLHIEEGSEFTVPADVEMTAAGDIAVHRGGRFAVAEDGSYVQDGGKLLLDEGGDILGVGKKSITYNYEWDSVDVSTETELLDAIEAGETTIRVVAPVTLTGTVAIPGDTTLVVDGGELTLAAGASLTVNGFLAVSNGTLTVESGAELVNAGLVQVGCELEPGMERLPTSLTVNGTYACVEGSLELHAPAVLEGIGAEMVNGVFSEAASEAELRAALAGLAQYANLEYAIISLVGDDMTLAANLTVPECVTLQIRNSVTVPADGWLTNNGALIVEGTLIVDGTLANRAVVMVIGRLLVFGAYTASELAELNAGANSTVAVSNLQNVNRYYIVETQSELWDALNEANKYKSVEIGFFGEELCLSCDLLIPSNVRLEMNAAMAVGNDIQCTVNGTIVCYSPLTVDGIWNGNGPVLYAPATIGGTRIPSSYSFMSDTFDPIELMATVAVAAETVVVSGASLSLETGGKDALPEAVQSQLGDSECVGVSLELQKNENTILPTGPVTVTLEGSSDFKSADCRVFRVGGNNAMVEMTVACEDNKITFSTGELGIFVVVFPEPVALSITDQPADFAGLNGDTATFTVTAVGVGRQYQWQYSTDGEKWANASGESARTPTYSVEVKSYRFGYQYRCLVTDVNGLLMASETAELKQRVCGASITAQPADFAGLNGDTATFAVTATGENLAYQWQYSADGGASWRPTSLTGCNTATLSVEVYAYRVGWQYRCKITDAYGLSVTTDAAELKQKVCAAEITAQPVDCAGVEGQNASFAVTATGESLSYQWQYSVDGEKWASASGVSAQTASYTVAVKAYRFGYQYRCKITDADGLSVTTDAAELTRKLCAASITAQPADFAGLAGDTATFTVTATGEGLGYQWYFSSDAGASWRKTSLSGFNTSVLTVDVYAYRMGYLYRCEITDADGLSVTTDAAELKQATCAATIKGQPEDCTAAVNTTATFTVTATGEGLTYQWYYSNTNGTKWAKTSSAGAQTATLSVSVKNYRYGYLYRCEITDALGLSVTTDAAALLARD